jgi:hypothetical protein
MSKSNHIRYLAKEKPDMTNAQIARIVQCSDALVSKVLRRDGSRASKKFVQIPYLDRANLDFVISGAESAGVAYCEFVNAIVTDARMEEQA